MSKADTATQSEELEEIDFSGLKSAINSPHAIWSSGCSWDEIEKANHNNLTESSPSLMKTIMDISKELPPELSKMLAPFLLRYGTDIQKFSGLVPPELLENAEHFPELAQKFGPLIKEGLNFLMEQKEKSRHENKEVIMNAIREMTPEIALAVADTMEQYEIKTRLAQQELGQ